MPSVVLISKLLKMSWVSDLPAFLPKFVPKGPSFLAGIVVFTISLLLAYLWYKRNYSSWFQTSNVALSADQAQKREAMLGTIYVVIALVVSTYLAKNAFSVKYTLDNHALNKEWGTYQTFWEAFK